MVMVSLTWCSYGMCKVVVWKWLHGAWSFEEGKRGSFYSQRGVLGLRLGLSPNPN